MSSKVKSTGTAKGKSSGPGKGPGKGTQNPKKQPHTPAEKTRRLFTSLCAQIDGGHFGNAVRTCDKILHLTPTDPDAHKTKLFLLLQTEQYDAALRLLGASPVGPSISSSGPGAGPLPSASPGSGALSSPSPGSSPADAHPAGPAGAGDDPSTTSPSAGAHETHGTQTQNKFELAYTLYRLHREDDARNVLWDVQGENDAEKEKERGVVHLEAQMSYRTGAYDQAVELYTQLLETADPNSEEHTDILTNLHAAQAHLDFTTTGFKHALDLLPASLAGTIQTVPPPSLPSSSSSFLTTSTASARVVTTSYPPKDKDKDKETAEPAPEKKPRRSRVPPGVIPGVTPPPDPERWIKKSERTTSTFGGRRRKAQGAGAGGGGSTQGSVSLEGGKEKEKEKEKESVPAAGKKGRRRK